MLQQVLAQRDGDRLRTVRRAELGEDGGKVFFYAVFAYVKLLGDVGVGEPARDGMEYLGSCHTLLKRTRVETGGFPVALSQQV